MPRLEDLTTVYERGSGHLQTLEGASLSWPELLRRNGVYWTWWRHEEEPVEAHPKRYFDEWKMCRTCRSYFTWTAKQQAEFAMSTSNGSDPARTPSCSPACASAAAAARRRNRLLAEANR